MYGQFCSNRTTVLQQEADQIEVIGILAHRNWQFYAAFLQLKRCYSFSIDTIYFQFVSGLCPPAYQNVFFSGVGDYAYPLELLGATAGASDCRSSTGLQSSYCAKATAVSRSKRARAVMTALPPSSRHCSAMLKRAVS